MKFCQCSVEKKSMCLPLPNGSATQSKRIGNMNISAKESLDTTGGTLADLWRNMEPIDTMVKRYVQPMFSQLNLTVGINRSEGEERKRTPLLASSASSLFSKGVKIGGTWNSLMLLGFAGFSVCMFRQCDWRNIFMKYFFTKGFSKRQNEKKIVNDSRFVNPRNYYGGRYV